MLETSFFVGCPPPLGIVVSLLIKEVKLGG